MFCTEKDFWENFIQDLKTCVKSVEIVSQIHHKIAIIDDAIWWEGSLNILSFGKSGEHMRRFEGPEAKTLLHKIGASRIRRREVVPWQLSRTRDCLLKSRTRLVGPR